MSNLHYEFFGRGETCILFLHGFLEHSEMWNNYHTLSKQFKILLIDLPGHGKSPIGPGQETLTMGEMAEQINHILETLNIEKIVFIGHSMGGYVGLAFAELFPKKILGLGLFFSTPLADSNEKKTQRLRAIETVKKNKESFIRVGIPILFHSIKLNELKKEVVLAKTWAMETNTTGIIACLNGMRLRPNRSAILQNLNIPCFVLMGTFDNAVDTSTLKQVANNQKHIKTKELPIGHMGHLEAPKECFDFVSGFLQQFN